MASEIIGLIGICSLFVLLALRIPIGLSLLSISFCGIWAIIGLDGALGILRVVPYSFAANWQLSSIPMFLFVGLFCFHAGMTQPLFAAARVVLSWLPGGLAVASIFGASGFASITGSSVACSAAMGRIAIPEMMRYKYNPSLATGTIAAAGTIGALIPPSILLIIYGILAQQSITNLFLGGAVAGLLSAAAYIVVVQIWVYLKPDAAPRVVEHFSAREKVRALLAIWPAVLLVITVFGGLFSGVFTATEAGAVSGGVAIVISLIIRTFSWAKFRSAIVDAFSTTSALLLIATGADLLARFVALSGAGASISDFVIAFSSSPLVLLTGVIILYMLLGTFLEPMGMMLLTLPIVLPVAEAANFNMIWFGIIVAKLLETGNITPPVGINVFVTKSVVGDLISTSAIFRGVFVFVVADLAVVILLMMFPDLVLFFIDQS